MSKALAPDFDQRHIAFINPETGCTLLDRIRCCRQIQMALWKNKTISTGLVELGLRSSSFGQTAARRSIRKRKSSHDCFRCSIWRRASVGGRFRPKAHRVYQPNNGMRLAGSDSVRPADSNGLEEEQKRYQQVLSNWVRSSSFGQTAARRSIQ